MEPYKIRQENEFEVLKSIFTQDLIDLRSHKKSRWKPLNLKIRLYPQQDSLLAQNLYVHVDLQIKCRNRYPDIKPIISIVESKGLSNELVKKLLKSLEKNKNSLKGEVMIYELAQNVQSFLHAHNYAPSGSFYDEMVTSNLKKDTDRLRGEKQRVEKNQKIMQDRVQQRLQLLRFQQYKDFLTTIDESKNFDDLEPPRGQKKNSPDCSHQCSEVLYFPSVGKKIQKGRCLHHSTTKGFISFAGIDLETGQLFFVTEWRLKHIYLENESLSVDDTINYIQKEVQILSGIRHQNLINYVGITFSRKKSYLVVYLLQDFISGVSIKAMKTVFAFSVDNIKYLAQSILDVLNFLHEKGVIHQTLQTSNVFLDDKGIIKIANFSLYSYLSWLSTGKKCVQSDFVAFGNFIEFLSPKNSMVLKDFIEKCMSTSTVTAYDLKSHDFLNVHNCFDHENTSKSLQPMNFSKLETKSNSILMETSRLNQEFEVLAYLGRGAYGDVLKVKKLLDNRLYAIKKIKLPAGNQKILKKITREVELLSRLNHENVVRYYNSWIEIGSVDAESHKNDSSFYIEKSQRTPLPDMIHITKISETCDWLNMSNDGSDSIEFAKSSPDNQFLSRTSSSENINVAILSPKIEFMYIQMEFCEKSTLRSAIDSGLHKNPDRVWRLFREICEGLAHIHQQGIIHRDLKPVNIFLDSRDQVKIGDFGLATTSMLVLQDTSTSLPEETLAMGSTTKSLTGKVGTALYIAPELAENVLKLSYDQKVDIYSLGIIFFEMCYNFKTGMERIQHLIQLRVPSIHIPETLEQNPAFSNQNQVIKWLLNHDPKKRPTAEDILMSDLVPLAKVENNELQEMLRHVLNNPQSRIYKHLIARCLDQENDFICELTYHMDMQLTNMSTFNLVLQKIRNIFVKHSALEITTPLLNPYTNKNIMSNAVKLMTHSGSIVTLPYDLRSPFIKYVVLNDIKHMRRYCIERVYREKRVYNFHPKQIFECAFDIITPFANHVHDAEIIFMAYDIVNEIPALKHNKISFRLNHTGLLHSILLYCNIPTEHYHNVVPMLSEFIDNKISKFHLMSNLNSLIPSIKDTVSLLVELIQIETTIENINSTAIRKLTRSNDECSNIFTRAIKELESIINLVRVFGVLCPIYICAGWFSKEQFKLKPASILWNMEGEIVSGRHTRLTTLATGGRFDGHLIEFQDLAKLSGLITHSDHISGVGFSFAPDKITFALKSYEAQNIPNVDILICVEGVQSVLADRADILKTLWRLDLKTCLTEFTNIDDSLEYAKDNMIKYLLFIKKTGMIKFYEWEKQQFQEQLISNKNELMSNVLRRFFLSEQKSTCTNLMAQSSQQITINSTNKKDDISHAVEFNFLVPEKITSSKRKRLESQIVQNMFDVLSKFSKKQHIKIIVVNLSIIILKGISGILDINCFEDDKCHALDEILERFPKQRKYLSEIYFEIKNIVRTSKVVPVIALYSISDTYYRFLL